MKKKIVIVIICFLVLALGLSAAILFSEKNGNIPTNTEEERLLIHIIPPDPNKPLVIDTSEAPNYPELADIINKTQ